jgi:hypothetical protein
MVPVRGTSITVRRYGSVKVKRKTNVITRGPLMIISLLVTFLVIILVLYLINMLPIDGRAKQICRVIVIILGVLSLLKYIAIF